MSPARKIKTLKTKIIIAGAPGAGKSFIARAADTCIPSQEIGVSIGKISETIEDTSREITLMTWAITEGRPRESTHLKHAQAAIVVCDLNKPETVVQTPEWANRILNYAGDIPIFFAANNVNQGSRDTYRLLRRVANKYNSACFPILAKDRESARDLLGIIAWELSDYLESEGQEELVSW